MSNLQFLSFFINTIAAVLSHEALMRASIASASNDYRLGSNEAPPAILSVFIGKQLTAVLDDLENVSKGKLSPEEKQTSSSMSLVKFRKSYWTIPIETEHLLLHLQEINLNSELWALSQIVPSP